MDIVVGWFRLQPGKREEFLAFAPRFARLSRAQQLEQMRTR